MSLREKASYVVYRFAEKGLEVFMLNDRLNDQGQLRFPQGAQFLHPLNEFSESDRMIELDSPMNDQIGPGTKAIAVEADWHELPSLREAIGDDVAYVKAKVKEIGSDFESGTYVGIKEAFKKVMPHEYALLKELKDILLDRNSVKNI